MACCVADKNLRLRWMYAGVRVSWLIYLVRAKPWSRAFSALKSILWLHTSLYPSSSISYAKQTSASYLSLAGFRLELIHVYDE